MCLVHFNDTKLQFACCTILCFVVAYSKVFWQLQLSSGGCLVLLPRATAYKRAL